MANETGCTTVRPWGSFTILEDANDAKVKRLVVNPGQRISLQTHKHRDEHWIVVAGIAKVTLDNKVSERGYGEHIFVKRGTKHRIACDEGAPAVQIIEVQVGDSFAETDIIRYSDDYGRSDS